MLAYFCYKKNLTLDAPHNIDRLVSDRLLCGLSLCYISSLEGQDGE